MTRPPIDRRVLPPAAADDRGQAVLSLFGRVSASFDWRPALAVTLSDVPSSMLPYAVRSLALQELVQPGMSEVVIRRMIANAVPLKAMAGTLRGVRYGLSLLGMKVTWKAWNRQVPMGAPGTYSATVFITEYIFDNQGALLDERVQRAALRMIDATKRWSQAGTFAIGVSAVSRLGAAAAGQALGIAQPFGVASPPKTAATSAGAAVVGEAIQIAWLDGAGAPAREAGAQLGACAALAALQFVRARMEATVS